MDNFEKQMMENQTMTDIMHRFFFFNLTKKGEVSDIIIVQVLISIQLICLLNSELVYLSFAGILALQGRSTSYLNV
jgi:hypothetical protein